MADPVDDMELQAHLSRYLCVLCSGYLEIALAAVLSEYAVDKSAPRVASYVSRNLNQFQNPKMSKILELVDRFDRAWGDEIRNNLRPEAKDAVDSIVANRNEIAHGRHTSLSLA